MSKDRTVLKKDIQAHNYKYTDLAQIHDYLLEQNIHYYQYIDRVGDDDYIMTVPIMDGKELPARRGVRLVDATLQGIRNPAQEQGSATTYARRYSLLMAFGLATEDDDAQSLSRKRETQLLSAKQLALLTKWQSEAKDPNYILETLGFDSLEEVTMEKASEFISETLAKMKRKE